MRKFLKVAALVVGGGLAVIVALGLVLNAAGVTPPEEPASQTVAAPAAEPEPEAAAETTPAAEPVPAATETTPAEPEPAAESEPAATLAASVQEVVEANTFCTGDSWSCYVAGYAEPVPGTVVVTIQETGDRASELGDEAARAIYNLATLSGVAGLDRIQTVDANGGPIGMSS